MKVSELKDFKLFTHLAVILDMSGERIFELCGFEHFPSEEDIARFYKEMKEKGCYDFKTTHVIKVVDDPQLIQDILGLFPDGEVEIHGEDIH